MSSHTKLITLCASLTALCAGCDPVGVEQSPAFRSISLDVDVSLTVADGGDDDGTIVWEILEVASVPASGETTWEVREYEPGSHPQDGGDDDGTIVWEILELTTSSPAGGSTTTWDLSDATGSLLCDIDDGELRDSSGTLLLQTVTGGIGGATGSLLYGFDRLGVNDAAGTRVLGTSPGQDSATDGRQLAIAALLEGECGS